MNRKLRHTILAFSVTGMMLAIGLMVARPLPATDAAADRTALQSQPAPAGNPTALRSDLRPRQPHHSALVDIAATEQAILIATRVLAALVVDEDVAELVEDTAADVEQAPPPRRTGSVRGAVAVPYFSFARAAGRGGRS